MVEWKEISQPLKSDTPLKYLVSKWPFASLGLSFLFCKMGTVTITRAIVRVN